MGISTEKGMGKITRQENERKFGKIDRWPLTMRSIDWGTSRPVRRGWEFKWPPAHFISHISSSRACRPFTYLLPEVILGWLLVWLKAWTLFWDEFELGFWFETQGFTFWERLLSAPCVSGLFQLLLRAPRASGLWLLLLISFPSLFGFIFLLIYFIGWHQGERRALPGLRASTLLSHLSPSRRRLAERRGLTRHCSVRMKTISATSKNLPRGKSS